MTEDIDMLYVIGRSSIPHGGPDDDHDLVPLEQPIGYATLAEAQTELTALIKDGPISDDSMMGEDPEGHFLSIIHGRAFAVKVTVH